MIKDKKGYKQFDKEGDVMIYTMHLVLIRLVLKFATRYPLLLYANMTCTQDS